MVKNKNKKIEIANSLSHLAGAFLGILFLVLMVKKAMFFNDPNIPGYAIYGVCFIFMFLSSALYHAVFNKKAKKVMRVFDHSAIFIFIAGSYTPIILETFSGFFRIFFLMLVWSIALGGMIFKFFTFGKYDRFKKISVLIYCLMGWIAVFMFKELIVTYPWQFMILLIAGGLLYTVGTLFYKMKRPEFHIVWHFFVLFAAITHFIGYYVYMPV